MYQPAVSWGILVMKSDILCFLALGGYGRSSKIPHQRCQNLSFARETRGKTGSDDGTWLIVI